MKPNVHWLLYPILIASLLGALWLWRDTAESQKIKAAVESAVQAQKTSDSQVAAQVSAANSDLQKQNSALQSQLKSAKTTQQQIQLINKVDGTSIQAENPPMPDAPIPVQPEDIQKLAVQSTSCAESENQVAADKVQIAADRVQIDSRDQTIKEQKAEITEQAGGSHFKRFLKATKYWGIGAGMGVITGILIEKK